MKNKTDNFNKQTLLQFSTWHSLYLSSEMPETHGMARAFLEQTLHLAQKTGVLSPAEKQELEQGSRKENPIRMVNEWLEFALPNVLAICGERELTNRDARLVGVFMLVCEPVRNFVFEAYHSPKGVTCPALQPSPLSAANRHSRKFQPSYLKS